MSEVTDSTKQSSEKKRSSSPEPGATSPPMKIARVDESSGDLLLNSRGLKNGNTDDTGSPAEKGEQKPKSEDQNVPTTYSISAPASSEVGDAHPSTSGGRGDGPCTSSTCAHAQLSVEQSEAAAAGSAGACVSKGPQACAPPEQSDWAAMAAAEALASLTRGGEDQDTETVHSSKQLDLKKKHCKKSGKRNSPTAGDSDDSPTPGKGRQPHAAAADSSTSSPEGGIDTSRVGHMEGEEEDEDDEDNLLSDTSSSPSSSSVSDEEDNGDDAECAIVSVKMAPEMRQSVALLAQVQMRLEALEKKATRLHQRVELKFSQQRRPHLDQRGAIIQRIPGFWVTAFLNHPQLSSHIDETDEDALSYMTNIEVESFKSNKLGYRIAFHFSRNAYFQNSVIFKEFHHGMGGNLLSFSNPILWHRGKNLTSQSHLVKEPGSAKIYTSFFSWFSDHSNPGRDEIAGILKDDVYRNPLRYYLTPLWEPRQNGSGHRIVDDSEGNECVVISDSDEEEGEEGPEVSRDLEDEDEEQDSGESSEEDDQVVIESSGDSEDGDQGEEESSPPSKEERNGEELDVEELSESTSQEMRVQEDEQDNEAGRMNDS